MNGKPVDRTKRKIVALPIDRVRRPRGRLFIVACVMVLAACSTPGDRAARMEAQIDEMMQVYGPACQKFGFARDSDGWRNCVLKLDQRAYRRELERMDSFTTCFGSPGFYQCGVF